MTVTLNIALELPHRAREHAIEYSRRLSTAGNALFVLDGHHYHPHITLYAPTVPKKNVGAIEQTLGEMLGITRAVDCQPIDVHARDGYVAAGMFKSCAIESLHHYIVHGINYLREGNFRDTRNETDPVAVRLVREFGYSRVLERYEPHLTFARFKDQPTARRALDTIGGRVEAFTAPSIGVYERGEHGTCIRRLKHFELNHVPW